MTISSKLRQYTENLERQGLLRRRILFQTNLITFDSNDYLSLLGDRRIALAYEEGYRNYVSGSGASMLLSGYHPNHRALEQAFAELLEVDDCILFSSGYAANLALTSLLGVIGAYCFIDKGVHASVYDGLKLSQAQYTRFLHNDLDNLSSKLIQNINASIILTEGIFSMSGQIAPLARMSKLSNVPLIVDEAHSFGVMGKEGRGSVSFHQLSQEQVPLRLISFGKAFAAQGAVIAGKQEWIDALIQSARSLIYSTAISPALSYGLLKTLDIIIAAEERRTQLAQLIVFFKEKILSSPLTWRESNTAIQQVQLGCPYRALNFTQELRKQGFSCSAIRTPTVSLKETGIRIVLNYNHNMEQINSLFKKLHHLYEYSSY